MHVISKDQLLSALDTAAPITNHSHVNTLYERIRLTIQGVELSFQATDAIITVVGKRDVMMSQGSSDFSVKCSDLLTAVKAMPDGGISVKLLDDGILEVSSGRRHFRAATVPLEDTSPLPDWDGPPPVGVPAAALEEVIRKVQHASQATDSRALDGVLLTMGDRELRSFASDGYRVASAFVPVESDQKLSIAIRQPLLPSLLAAVARFPASEVGVSETTRGLRLDTEVGTFFYAAAAVSMSPAVLWNMLRLTAPKTEVVVKTLADSVKYVSMASKKERPGVVIRGKAKGVSLQLSAMDGQSQTNDEVMAEVEEDVVVKLEPHYLLQALAQAGPKACLMHVADSNVLRISGERFEAALGTVAL